ncbi:MAG: response regulator [gamma proteobacterium symbiont of Taylorina sp.]|nr:response regulator [gamma proteobacterium symbiont of Taylorina sp.]
MQNDIKIFVIEHEKSAQYFMSAFFSDFQIEITGSGEKALELINAYKPELILLTIDSLDIDGYSICEKIKNNESSKNIPVIFLSEQKDLQDKLKAYGVGATDYIVKPFDVIEFKNKIDQVLISNQRIKDFEYQLSQSYSAVLDVQNNAAMSQSIIEFLQANLFCHDIASLFKLFFNTTSKFSSSCVLQIQGNNETFIQSDTGNIHQIEHEILNIADNFNRVHLFGEGRAIYNWQHATLLVRNIHDNSDNLTVLMDGVDATVKAINIENELLESVNSLKSSNDIIKDKVMDVFTEMNGTLKETFLSLGLVSSLSLEEEDSLADYLEIYQKKINSLLDELGDNNKTSVILTN